MATTINYNKKEGEIRFIKNFYFPSIAELSILSLKEQNKRLNEYINGNYQTKKGS